MLKNRNSVAWTGGGGSEKGKPLKQYVTIENLKLKECCAWGMVLSLPQGFCGNIGRNDKIQ